MIQMHGQFINRAKPETKKKQVHSETWNGVKHMQVPRLYIICSIWNPILKSVTQTGQNQKRELFTYEKRGYGRGYYWGHLVQTSGREQIQNCETLAAPLVYKTFYSWSQAATVAQTEAHRPTLWKEKSSQAAGMFKDGSTELVWGRWWAGLAIVAGVFCSTAEQLWTCLWKGPMMEKWVTDRSTAM